MEDEWPEIDFNTFPGNMISGLTYEEIVAVCNKDATTIPIPNELSYPVMNEPTTSSNACNSRFANPLTDDESTALQSSSIPQNTKRRNAWTLKLFEE